MAFESLDSTIALSKTTKFIVDNRGRTAPTAEEGVLLIATNCISNDQLYPSYDTVRKVSNETYKTWFRSHPEPGDIIITLKGSQNGAICLVPKPVDFAIAQDMVALRADEKVIDPLYLFAALRSPQVQWQIKNLDVSGVIPHFKKTDFDKLTLPYPPRKEQEEIGQLYYRISAKIEQNRRTGRKLEGLARAVFKAWFVDFEPVKAKAAGATAFPGMPAETFAALPTRFGDSELGPVPEGWEVKTLDSVLTLSKLQIKPQDYAEEAFEHFSIPAYDAGQNPVVEPGSAIKSQKFVVMPGCVLISKLNPRIARVWLPPSPNERRQIASTEFLVAIPQSGWTREFMYCLFQQDDFRDALAQSASGTSNSHQRVRPNDLLTRPLTVPPKSILGAFAEQVIPLMQLRAALQAESAKLAALRDYLLPRLLSGRVRVAEHREVS